MQRPVHSFFFLLNNLIKLLKCSWYGIQKAQSSVITSTTHPTPTLSTGPAHIHRDWVLCLSPSSSSTTASCVLCPDLDNVNRRVPPTFDQDI